MKLHLVNDEKIINRTIDAFEEVFPGENLFVVTNRTSSFKWVRKETNVLSRTEFFARKDEFSFSEVYIHLLNKRKMDVLNKLDLQGAVVYWIVWGMDLYNKLLVPKGFRMIDPTTSYYKRKNRQNMLWRPFDRWKQQWNARKTIRFIKQKVDYIVTDTTENDYQYLMRYYPELQSKPWKDFFYYPLDIILGKELMNSEVCGNSIMIGNSASGTNNHEYVMRILSKLDIGSRRVIVPLSYSGKKGYVDHVLQSGRLLLGENFSPLLDFMPLDEYNRLQSDVSVALFGNWRQEAIGNIIVALYLGAKVFLSHVNPVYEWAQSHGLTVYELEKLSQKELDTPLDRAAVKQHLFEIHPPGFQNQHIGINFALTVIKQIIGPEIRPVGTVLGDLRFQLFRRFVKVAFDRFDQPAHIDIVARPKAPAGRQQPVIIAQQFARLAILAGRRRRDFQLVVGGKQPHVAGIFQQFGRAVHYRFLAAVFRTLGFFADHCRGHRQRADDSLLVIGHVVEKIGREKRRQVGRPQVFVDFPVDQETHCFHRQRLLFRFPRQIVVRRPVDVLAQKAAKRIIGQNQKRHRRGKSLRPGNRQMRNPPPQRLQPLFQIRPRPDKRSFKHLVPSFSAGFSPAPPHPLHRLF